MKFTITIILLFFTLITFNVTKSQEKLENEQFPADSKHERFFDVIHQLVEDGRIAIRNVRRDGIHNLQNMKCRCFFSANHRFRSLEFLINNYILIKKYLIYGIRIKWISDSNSSHRKDSDGQIISPYGLHLALKR